MSTPNPRFTLTKTLSGVLPVDGNKVLIADLEAFLAAAKRKAATEVTFTIGSSSVVLGVHFSNEAAEA